jgi:hypothetical protein
MPQAIAAIGTWAFSALTAAGASLGVAIAGAFVAQAVLLGGVVAGFSALSKSLLPKLPEGPPQSRDVTVRGTVEYRQMIYGQVKTAGYIAFYGTSGTNNRFLWFAIVVAGHECEEISDVWLDALYVPDSEILIDGEVTTAEFQGAGFSRLYVTRHLGSNSQSVDAGLLSAFPEWDTFHIGRGIAYTVFRLDRNEDAYPTGAPRTFFQLVKGRKLYDPRLDSTNGGSGSHRTNNAATWAWSNNWALCVRDYISGGSVLYTGTPDKRLTIGELDARINDTYTTAAANDSDESVTIPPLSPVTTQARYTCDVQLSCGASHRENLETMLSAGVGRLAYVEGKYRICAGVYDTPSVILTDADILGPVEVSTHPNGAEVYNLVTGTFFDPEREWTLNPFPTQKNAFYAADDGGEYARDIDLHATTDSYRAQRISLLHLAQSRNRIVVNFSALSPKAMNIAELETFMVTISEYGWFGKVFRCLEWTLEPTGLPAMLAREDNADSYVDPTVDEYVDPVTLTVTSTDIENPDSPSDFRATPGVNGILFQWALPSIGRRIGLVKLYKATSGDPFALATQVWEGYAYSYFYPRTDLASNAYWIRQYRSGQESVTEPAGAGIEAAAASVTTALSINITPSSVSGSANVSGSNPQTVNTSQFAVASASGGTAPYTYFWSISSGYPMTVNAPTSTFTKFSAGPFFLDGSDRAAIARCTVTDATSATVYAEIPVSLGWPSIA